MLLVLLCVVVQVLEINSARILAYIPTPSYSHQSTFQPLWRELALRGHDLTVVTTDPQKNASLTNLKEIDLSFTYEIFRKHNFSELVIQLGESNINFDTRLADLLIDMQHAQFSSPRVKELIDNKDLRFDLVMVEVMYPGMLFFLWKFQCPFISILSYDCSLDFHTALGNPTHPVLNPDNNFNAVNSEDLTFAERISSLIQVLWYKFSTPNLYFPFLHDSVMQYFGNELPHLTEIQNNISMMFINTNPIFHQLRPLHLNTVQIGGMINSKEPKPLPQGLKEFLDGAENGAIYFSLGTFITHKDMPIKFRKALLDAISRIPYKVLVKLDNELEEIPKNVLVKKWVPQQDVLRHPNVKLFITQGGLLSLKEAVYNDVPVIGIPFIGEQKKNIDRVVKMGYGIKVNWKEMSEEILLSAIYEIMNNPRYQEKAKEMGAIFRDEEIPSLQRAVYWTEYVIRHKGAKHLRNPAYGMPTWKLYMLDVIGFLASVALMVIFASFMIMKFLIRVVLKLRKRSVIEKEKKN